MDNNQVRLTARVGYEPHFRWSYLLPKYWGVWFGIFLLLLLAFIPYRWRDKLASRIGLLFGKLAKKQRHRARVNLTHCFPLWSEEQKESTLDKMFVTLAQIMLGVGEVALFSKKHLQKRSEIIGFEHLTSVQQKGKNIILLVPHAWAIDASGIMLHSYNMPMTAMYNPHRNPLVDWLWNSLRLRFGGKVYARQNGIKPFLNSIKQGNMGYYLPDEDYGEQLSVYVDFFATYKATLPGLYKMARIANAEVIPMFPSYSAEKGKYKLHIGQPLTLINDDHAMARAMNEVIEYYVEKMPEQYTWILRILKTRKDGSDIYKMNE